MHLKNGSKAAALMLLILAFSIASMGQSYASFAHSGTQLGDALVGCLDALKAVCTASIALVLRLMATDAT
jgi:hypothetical protein